MRKIKLTRLLLIRHGETEWTAEKRYQGHNDLSLSRKGNKQIKSLSRQLLKENIDFIYCSKLKRARQSAQIIALTAKKNIRSDERLNEISFGLWEGKTAAQLIRAKDKAYLNWLEGKIVRPPGGESFASLKKRTSACVQAVLKKYKGKTIAVVSHGGVIRAILFELFRMPPHLFWAFQISPASVTAVIHTGQFPQIEYLNLTVPGTKGSR